MRGQFDFFPLLGVVVAVFLARVVLRLPLTFPTTLIATVAGTGWAWSVEAWGWPLPTLAGLVLMFSVALLISPPRPPRGYGRLD